MAKMTEEQAQESLLEALERFSRLSDRVAQPRTKRQFIEQFVLNRATVFHSTTVSHIVDEAASAWDRIEQLCTSSGISG